MGFFQVCILNFKSFCVNYLIIYNFFLSGKSNGVPKPLNGVSKPMNGLMKPLNGINNIKKVNIKDKKIYDKWDSNIKL